MPYDVGKDPYVDPTTGILRNILGITDARELEKAEADITVELIASLPDRAIQSSFDLAHLQSIHKELFGAIYPWAGKLRTVEITKGTTRFASTEFLERAAKQVFDDLQEENLLANLPDNKYIQRLAHYYSEVNILHPFREGNGRTQRAFFGAFAATSGRRIAWELMDVRENLVASIAAYAGDESGLVGMLTSIVKPQGWEQS